MSFRIETGIPIPQRERIKTYPFDDMKVMQSFYMAGKRCSDVSGCIGRASSDGKRFISRTVREHGKIVGVRIWRTK